jgi:error-prone DNA polymerase
LRTQHGIFSSAEDLALRVSILNKKELTFLARIGALNTLNGIAHRRDALWQVERASKLEGPLLRQSSECLQSNSQTQPLQQMNTDERLVADYTGTGLTVGKHPMHYRRKELQLQGVLSATDLQNRKKWGMGTHGRLHHCTATSWNRERIYFPFRGRRNRHCEHYYHA